MINGFIRVRDPNKGIITCWTQDGRIFDLSRYIKSDILGLIIDRNLNSHLFHEDLQSRLTKEDIYAFNFGEIVKNTPQDDRPCIIMPFEPPEVWGVGVSYHRTAVLHEEDIKTVGKEEGLYYYVLNSKRPEIFFKALARHCVGNNDFVGIRGDSLGTIVEAELACIFDSTGEIIAYTIVNDVTAWDIEKESPLFLSYAKIFTGSCAFGPCIVPAFLVPDPLSLEVTCVIERGSTVLYEGHGNTRNMKRSLGELSRYLGYSNAVPDGAILSTGTAVGIPNDLCIEDGDKITIGIEKLGMLCNVAKRFP